MAFTSMRANLLEADGSTGARQAPRAALANQGFQTIS